MANPFALPGTWLRCALHAHTTNSDGELPPGKLVRHYDQAGFDVLAITDHWVRTLESSTERLLVLPGTELDVALEGNRYAHVLALGIEADPKRPVNGYPGLAETVRWVSDNGGVPYLAHTYWSGVRTDEFESCEGLAGLEVYNAGCEVELGRGLASIHWDEALEHGRALFGIATDDSHHPHFDSLLAWVWARCSERSPTDVLAALAEGAFYSSTGPEIFELTLDEEAVELRCSPVASVTLVAGRMRGARVNAGRPGYLYNGRVLATNDDGAIVAARLERPPFTPYGRLEVEDGEGRVAWTNPLWTT